MRERRFDAAERIRTSTPVKARRPERRVYTSFTTAARGFKLSNLRPLADGRSPSGSGGSLVLASPRGSARTASPGPPPLNPMPATHDRATLS